MTGVKEMGLSPVANENCKLCLFLYDCQFFTQNFINRNKYANVN